MDSLGLEKLSLMTMASLRFTFPKTRKLTRYCFFTLFFTLQDIKVSEAVLVASSIPNFDVMSIPQLKQVAQEAGVKVKGANKEAYVAKLTKNWPFPKTLEDFVGAPAQRGTKFQKNPDLTFLGTKPPFHAFYADNFNYIDRFNRYFYKLMYTHKHMHSGPVRIWSLLNVALVQAWALYCEANQYSPSEHTLRTFTKEYLESELEWLRK